MIKDFGKKLAGFGEFLSALITCFFAVIVLHVVLWMSLEPTATAIMAILILLFTMLTFHLDGRRATRLTSTIGIALFILSWFVWWRIGVIEWLGIYIAADLLWSAALSRGLRIQIIQPYGGRSS